MLYEQTLEQNEIYEVLFLYIDLFSVYSFSRPFLFYIVTHFKKMRNIVLLFDTIFQVFLFYFLYDKAIK